MRPGVPGFIPERFQEAREARGLTQVALSDLLGVSRQAVSQYERNSAVPSPETLARTSDVLRIPVSYFMQQYPEDEDTPHNYRSMSAATKRERTRSERRYLWLKRICDYLENFVEFPEVSFPQFDLPSDFLSLSDELIEQAALEIRQEWRLGGGPIRNLVATLERNGLIVARFYFDAATLDAFSNWRYPAGRPFVIIGSDKEAAAKSRFDAAHELAHLVLHRKVESKALRKKEEFKELEKQAHRFAGALLLPEEAFSRDFLVATLGYLETLKKKWNVSIGAMLMRAQALGLIEEDQTRRLWRGYARRGYRRREPLDDLVAPEEPTLLRNSLELLISEGVATRESVLAALHLSAGDVEELLGLDSGYFSTRGPGQMLRFQPLLENAEKGDSDDSERGSVLPFPR